VLAVQVMMGYGSWLREQRDLIGVSQTRMAKLLGMSRGNLSQIENEHNYSTGKPIPVTAEFVRRTARILQQLGAAITDYEAFKAADMTVPDEPTLPGEEAILLLDRLTETWEKVRKLRDASHAPAVEQALKLALASPSFDLEKILHVLSAYGSVETSREPFMGEIDAGVSHWIEPRTAEEAGAIRFIQLRVRGHCMEPEFPPGSLLRIRLGNDASDGAYVIARIGDEVSFKQFFRENGTVVLKPLNPEHDALSIREDTESFEIQGVVVGVFYSIEENRKIRRSETP
jgi:SOS-response transcriptional repressor LexA